MSFIVVLTIVCRTKISVLLHSTHVSLHISMTAKILKKFGQRVRDERLKRGLSQEALAEKAGVHRTYIGMIERAEKNITLTNVEKIAKALGLRIGNLFDGSIE